MNSPIPYFGGKSRMSKSIIDRIPEHITYVEVFGGAAWVLFKKPPSKLEVLNDLDRHLINFYRVTKYHLEALVNEIATMQPSRELFYLLRDDIDRPTMTDIQRAAAYYYIQRFAFAGRPHKPTFATGPSHSIRCRTAIIRRTLPLVAERLKNVMLENLPWERFIKLYDSEKTFFFVDPPYMGHNEYRHNFKFVDFEFLAAALKSLQGRFLMTHSDSPEIRKLFDGHNIEPIVVGYSTQLISKVSRTKMGHEVLISNY